MSYQHSPLCSPPQHTHELTLLLSSALPGHVPDTSGGTSCTTHYLTLTLAFHCSWPSLKSANKLSRAGRGRLKAEGGAESLPCSQHGCLPAQDGFLQPQLLRNTYFIGPRCWDLRLLGAVLQEEEQRGFFLVFFSGGLAPPCPSRACYYYQKYQTFQLKLKSG